MTAVYKLFSCTHLMFTIELDKSSLSHCSVDWLIIRVCLQGTLPSALSLKIKSIKCKSNKNILRKLSISLKVTLSPERHTQSKPYRMSQTKLCDYLPRKNKPYMPKYKSRRCKVSQRKLSLSLTAIYQGKLSQRKLSDASPNIFPKWQNSKVANCCVQLKLYIKKL
jgi:hypothetical protein